MIWSKYNVLFFSPSNKCHLLFNLLSGLLMEVDSESYSKLKKLKEDLDMNLFDNEFISFLKKNKVLVANDYDEISKVKLGILCNRYNTKKLKLTIAPTMACNFNCAYCYEKDRPHIYMDERVERAIMTFIEKKKAESISICWYGGEPLLAIPKIKSMTKEIKKLSQVYHAAIVTNGYLMDADFIKMIEDLSIKTVQVTIDGNRETHNKRRPYKINGDSYDRIINNIYSLATLNKNVTINVRVNVDKNNMNEYIKPVVH